MDETFILSNIAPQVGVGFNRHCMRHASRVDVLLTDTLDWSYVEDWCRRLTNNFTDVYVFTVALYLPKQDPDGKWRVVSVRPQFLEIRL
jgi:endonuclease G